MDRDNGTLDAGGGDLMVVLQEEKQDITGPYSTRLELEMRLKETAGLDVGRRVVIQVILVWAVDDSTDELRNMICAVELHSFEVHASGMLGAFTVHWDITRFHYEYSLHIMPGSAS